MKLERFPYFYFVKNKDGPSKTFDNSYSSFLVIRLLSYVLISFLGYLYEIPKERLWHFEKRLRNEIKERLSKIQKPQLVEI